MSEETIIVLCPKCHTKNRIPKSRWGEHPRCGKCKQTLDPPSLFPDTPIDVTDTTFQKEVAAFPGLVLVDFTAPW